METNKIWDVIIIGAGPAGLTAAIYGSRRSLSTLVITKDIGGQAAMTNSIENYPGFLEVEGPKLMNIFQEQAKKCGAEFVFAGVEKIEQPDKDGLYSVVTPKESYSAHAVILAFGLEHRKLAVPGEDDFYGKGVTYCATCDGPLFKGKTITVVGGGNSALDAIDYMSKIATKVYALVRGEKFKGEEVMVDVVSKLPNVEIRYNTEIAEIKGEKFVQSVIAKNKITSETEEIPLNGVFVEAGYQANTKLYGHLVETTPQGAIIVDKDCNTSRPGFYAAGDVTTLSYKQIITSGGEGCKAVLTAYTYIQKKKGGSGALKADHKMA